MLSLPNDGRYPALEPVPEQRRQKTLEALGVQVETLASSSPVLMILEDAHWGDPTSLEAFGRIVDQIATLRVLLIVTFRPEFEAPWVGRPHVTALALNRLGHHDVGSVIDYVVGNKLLPANIRKDIIERTDGIPLFVEEMTKAVLEAGGKLEAMQTAAATPSLALAVPASLHASLMARLDRLGPAKELAQIGAAIGREFSHALLGAVALKPEAELGSSFDRLIRAGLLFRKGVPPNATYLFKHARSALVEAVEQLTRALGQIATLPSTPVLRRDEIKLQVALIRPLQHVKGLAAPEARAAAERACLLIEQAEALGEPPQDSLLDSLLLFSALGALLITYIIAFNGEVARERAAQLLALAEKQGGKVPLMLGHRAMGGSLLFTGNLVEGRVHLDQVIALYNPVEHRSLGTGLGQDFQVGALIYRSLALWALGYPEAALADAEQALSEAREIGHAGTLMVAIGLTCLIQLMSGNYAIAKAQSDELIGLGEENGSAYWEPVGMLRRASLLALTGKTSDAVSIFTSVIPAYRSTGARIFLPIYLSLLARACGDLGKFDDAWSYIDEAMMTVETTKETWYEADVHRIAGEIALMSPERDAAKAEARFERALAVARAQQAKSFELRAAMSMARLWRDQGKRDEARELLAPVHGWFTEGFDTLDLKQAKALLDELK
jgi:tetratricopeptide (TPR) repeat protein